MKSWAVRSEPPADCLASGHAAAHDGSLDRIEIVIVRHEGRPQLQAGCGVHAILYTLCAEIGLACADEAFLDVNDFHRFEDRCGEGSRRGPGQELGVAEVLRREELTANEAAGR